jgi:hypothetical protein
LFNLIYLKTYRLYGIIDQAFLQVWPTNGGQATSHRSWL